MALNASMSVMAARRISSVASRSAALPAHGKVAAAAMHATQAIDAAELEILAHMVVPLSHAVPSACQCVVVRMRSTPPLAVQFTLRNPEMHGETASSSAKFYPTAETGFY